MSEIDISAIPHIARHASHHADNIVVVYEGRPVTYREFYEQVAHFASSLRADGVGHGDRVAYVGVNSLTFLVSYFASIWVGAAFVPLNFRLAGPEMRAVLLDARPGILVAEPDHAKLVDEFLEELAVRRALLVDDDPNLTNVPLTSTVWESYSAFRTREQTITAHDPCVNDHLAALLYTSGTTGKSKGVMLTHGNLWWNWLNVDSVVDTRVGDVSLAVAPLFHIGGFNALTLRVIVRGGTIVIRRAFDPAQALADLQEYRINSMFLVPAMLAAIQRVDGFDAADLSQLRSTIVAGAPVPPALIASFAEKNVFLQQAWGLTETAPFSTYLEADMTTAKLGSCGLPMPYTHVKIVNPSTMQEVTEAGAAGEFWVKGPNVSKGYWNNPEATAAAFTEDGWFRTGDLGYRDAEGYLFIVDRLKDMIISGGENVYPAEVENSLSAHPAVADIAVVGVPDPKWGESVCAVVALHDGTELSLEEARDFAAKSLARYKLPSRLVIFESIPRNGAGKLDKPLIRKQVLELLEGGAVQAAPMTASFQTPVAKK